MAEANIAVAITKQTMWHGVQEQFDNVYYYDGPPVTGSNPDLWKAVVDAVVAAEKPVHGTNVEFITGRIWSAGGTILQNVTLGLFDLDGFGTGLSVKYFKEAAVLVEWECDRVNVLGRKVYLRKFIRPCSVLNGASDAMMQGEAQLDSVTKGPFKAYANKVQELSVGASLENFVLTSPTGRQPRNPQNGVVNNYLISREFRRN